MRPTRRSCAGSATGWSTGCGSTTRTAWPTRRATCSGCGRPPAAYLLIEKILEPGEAAARRPVEGTTGYDALADVDRRVRRPRRPGAARRLYPELSGGSCRYEDMIRGTKRRITDGILHAEMLRLARLLPDGPRRRGGRLSPR